MTKSKGVKRPDWKWTEKQDALLVSSYSTTTKAELARQVGCTVPQVLNRAAKLRLKTPGGATRRGLKKSAEALVKLKESMRRAAEEGRLKAPAPEVMEAARKALARLSPEKRAQRAARAGNTMRGIPQRMEGRSAAAEHNARAKTFVVLDPAGLAHQFTNLNHFVRQNASLFSAEDTVWGGDRKFWCRAQRGLGSLFRNKRPKKSWKGWTAVSKWRGDHGT